jgi:hypothetical protein
MKRASEVPQGLYRPRKVPDHALRGSLMLESSKRVISHRLTDIYNVVQCTLPEVNIPILNVANTNVVARGSFMAHYYSMFCLSTGDPAPNKTSLAAAMLGLLFNVVDPTRIIGGNNELHGHCAKAGFIPKFIIINNQEDISDIAMSDHVQAFLEKFGNGAALFLNDQSQQLVMLGPILLTIGKNIQVEGYAGWMTRRIRAFMGTLGLESTEIIWTDATYPAISTMNDSKVGWGSHDSVSCEIS